MYTLERKYRFSLNWVCSKNSNTTLRCPARCVTDTNNSRRITLGHRPHNHPVTTLKAHKSRRRTNEMRKEKSNRGKARWWIYYNRWLSLCHWIAAQQSQLLEVCQLPEPLPCPGHPDKQHWRSSDANQPA